MTEVRTRDEALASVDSGLAQWMTTVVGVLAQASASASAAESAADRAVRRLASKVAALRLVLASSKPDDDSSRVERELTEALGALDAAKQASQRVSAVVHRLQALQRSHVQSSETLVTEARADLAKRSRELGSYRRGGGGTAASGGGAGSTTAAAPSSWPGAAGLINVDVASADFSDNPLVGSFGRGDTTRSDYRWAVQTWDEVVGPGVARGMTRADFEARDAARGAPPLRQTASVFDLFLGDSDRLSLTRRADGSLDVINGRHRLEVARELGIKSLPGVVIEP